MNQKVSVQSEYDETFKVPAVQYGDSMEEQALRKEQDRHKEDMKKRQKDELSAVQQQTDKESKQAEAAAKKQYETELEQAIREKKNRQAAEIQARPDLTKDQMDAVSMNTKDHEILGSSVSVGSDLSAIS